MDGIRTGIKKPTMSISKSKDSAVTHGKCLENTSKHVAKNSNMSGGQGVYGMPLFSAASKVSGD